MNNVAHDRTIPGSGMLRDCDDQASGAGLRRRASGSLIRDLRPATRHPFAELVAPGGPVLYSSLFGFRRYFAFGKAIFPLLPTSRETAVAEEGSANNNAIFSDCTV